MLHVHRLRRNIPVHGCLLHSLEEKDLPVELRTIAARIPGRPLEVLSDPKLKPAAESATEMVEVVMPNDANPMGS
jgi:hypothetical protein